MLLVSLTVTKLPINLTTHDEFMCRNTTIYLNQEYYLYSVVLKDIYKLVRSSLNKQIPDEESNGGQTSA
jgi:hypothetical protein